MRDQCSAQIFSLVLIITRQSRTPITTLTNTSSHLTFTVHHRTSLSHVTCHVYMRVRRTLRRRATTQLTAHSLLPSSHLPRQRAAYSEIGLLLVRYLRGKALARRRPGLLSTDGLSAVLFLISVLSSAQTGLAQCSSTVPEH